MEMKSTYELTDVSIGIPLSDTGRPNLFPDEIQLYQAPSINIYNQEIKTKYRLGKAVVTNFRILWIHEAPPCGYALALSAIVSVQVERGFLSRSGKLNLSFQDKQGGSYFKFSFKAGERNEFYQALELALKNKAWQKTAPSVIQDRRLEEQRNFSTTNAGISGILRQQQKQQLATSKLASTAFSDLESLMEKAKDVVGRSWSLVKEELLL